MALAAHVLRLCVLVQGIFGNLGCRFQKMRLCSSMREVTTQARHFTAGERIVTSTHRMTLVGMSHGVVSRKCDGRQVMRRNTLRLAQVAVQAKIVDVRAQESRVRRHMRVVAPHAHPGGVRKVRVGVRRRFMTVKAHHSLSLLENYIGCVPVALDAMAGSASALDCGMNMITGRMVGMTFQAVCILIHPSRM